MIFVRHGENEANLVERMTFLAPGAPLTEKGFEQARELAGELAGRCVTALYTSPLVRARQTASVLGDSFGVPAIEADGLAELRVPELEGAPLAEGLRALAEPWSRWLDAGELDYRPFPSSESAAEVIGRFQEVLREVGAAHPAAATTNEEDVVLVAHGGILQLCVPLLSVNLPPGHGRDNPLHNCARIATTLAGADRLTCVNWNGVAAGEPA
ncbi:histidine phosphatase family protein [Streptomyces sp. NPDC058252]|uniref:histidine phosphatase family protein n=1 Tax=Streptomyces sp. NPDC058252 TaxID=3346405 RepID=UPI0036E1CB4B